MPTPAQNVEVVGATHCLGQQLGGQNLFLTPNHAILECGVNFMLFVQTGMHHLNVVHQTHEHIGLQRLHLIEIERTEQTVSPAERGVGVDDQVRVIFDGMASIDDVFECRPAKRGQTRDGQIKNPTIPNIRGFLVHHLPDMERVDAVSASPRQVHDLAKVVGFVHTNLSGHNCSHSDSLPRTALRASHQEPFFGP